MPDLRLEQLDAHLAKQLARIGTIKTLLLTMRAHLKAEEVQEHAAGILRAVVSASDGCRKLVVEGHGIPLGIDQAQARHSLYGTDTVNWQLKRGREQSQSAALLNRRSEYKLVIVAPGQHTLQCGARAVVRVKLRCATRIRLTCGQQRQDLIDIYPGATLRALKDVAQIAQQAIADIGTGAGDTA